MPETWAGPGNTEGNSAYASVSSGRYNRIYHRLGFLNNRFFLFLKILEAEKSKIKPADLVPVRILFQVCGQLPSSCVLTWHRENESAVSLSFSSYHYINPSIGTLPLKTSSKPDFLPMAPPAKAIMLRVKASTYEWGSGGQKQSIGF